MFAEAFIVLDEANDSDSAAAARAIAAALEIPFTISRRVKFMRSFGLTKKFRSILGGSSNQVNERPRNLNQCDNN